MTEYLQYFELNAAPFSLAPRTESFFASFTHERLIAAVDALVKRRDGGMCVLGDSGTGKTLLSLIVAKRQLNQGNVVCYINARECVDGGIIAAVASSLGAEFDDEQEAARMIEAACGQLALRGRRLLVVVDDADILNFGGITGLSVLAGITADDEKLVSLVLFARKSFVKKLGGKEYRALRKKLFYYYLPNLTKAESLGYLQYRIWQAKGAVMQHENIKVFDKKALAYVSKLAGGNPAFMNMLADRSMHEVFIQGRFQIVKSDIRRALKSQPLLWPFLKPRRQHMVVLALFVFMVAVNIALVYMVLSSR